ncbi:SURF1 family protein [Nocardioides sp. Bht2]|uniref:SURF1 family cytochrome oxidase biogenesis protein n=1 Tax=Nocardioides sp. Bht2 TaxID=3392297 RepID=UPI0039B4912A
MRSLSFFFSRRWILFLVTVIALAWGAWWLGEWQFHRLDDRKEKNAIIERNEAAEPVPAAEVLSTENGVSKQNEWRRVTATGTYDVDNTIVVRYRTRDGAAGVDVVVPLVTEDGTSLIVDRGWMATENRGTRPEELPAPPSGEVTVVGWVRKDATGDSTKVNDHSTRSISAEKIAEATGNPTFRGFVDLVSEDPDPESDLKLAELPEINNGPHFFYGLQWWFFGFLALLGFVWMAVDEWRGGRKQPATAETADVDEDANA